MKTFKLNGKKVVKCFRCKGKGKCFDSDNLLIPIIGWIDPFEECDICKGKGFLEKE